MAMSKAENLPQEIIVDILSRLPAKSVGQYRCVSKHWFRLLSDPQFIKAHLTSPSNQEQDKLIIVSDSCSLHTITFNPQNGNDGISRKLNFQQLPENNWVAVHGSCNGLVLVGNGEGIKFLVNPTTLEYHEIPKFHLALSMPVSCRMYGLGYDVVGDDYKVVTLSYTVNEYVPTIDDIFVDVHSVRKGIWRRLESSPYYHDFPELVSGVFVNGALHWLAKKKILTSTDDSYIIVAFSLSDEKFLEVPPPTAIDNDDHVYYELVVLRGCLCMFTDPKETKIDVWMMKEYGVEQSWTKFEVKGPGCSEYLIPKCLLSDDDVVLDADGPLIIYNIREDQWRIMIVDEFPTIHAFAGTGTFRESLVSPTLRQEAQGYSLLKKKKKKGSSGLLPMMMLCTGIDLLPWTLLVPL